MIFIPILIYFPVSFFRFQFVFHSLTQHALTITNHVCAYNTTAQRCVTPCVPRTRMQIMFHFQEIILLVKGIGTSGKAHKKYILCVIKVNMYLTVISDGKVQNTVIIRVSVQYFTVVVLDFWYRLFELF